VIIIFFESIVKNTLESPLNLAENLLENPGKEFYFTVGYPVELYGDQKYFMNAKLAQPFKHE